MDGLAASIGTDRSATAALARSVQRLAPRWFVIRDAHVNNGIALLQPRWAMPVLRGPMTRTELKRAREDHARVIGRVENACAGIVSPRGDVPAAFCERGCAGLKAVSGEGHRDMPSLRAAFSLDEPCR
jgi:hypothetical protein